MNEGGSNITVTLYNTCAANQTCAHGHEGKDSIFERYTINGTCSTPTETEVYTDRYAGEDCNDNHKCVNDLACTGAKCVGVVFNGACNKTIDCNSGLFCNGTNKCSTQLKDTETCKSTYDCDNSLGCFDGKCTAWAKKPIGTVLKDKVGNWTEEALYPFNYFCETGDIDVNQTCSASNYTGPSKADGKIDAKGFVKCDWNEDCSYTDGVTTSTKKCGCGYNINGQGYCPLPSGQNYKTWVSSIQNGVKVLKNDCHSLSRFTCYKFDTKLLGYAKYSAQQTVNAHMFYGAVSCASDVLGSAYINMSVALIAIIFAFLF